MVRQSVLEKSKHLRFVFLGVFLGGVSRFELADLSILNDIGLMLVVIASLLFMLIYFIKRTVLPRQIGLTLFFFAVFVVWHVVLVIVYGVHERSILIILGLLIAGLVYVSASIFSKNNKLALSGNETVLLMCLWSVFVLFLYLQYFDYLMFVNKNNAGIILFCFVSVALVLQIHISYPAIFIVISISSVVACVLLSARGSYLAFIFMYFFYVFHRIIVMNRFMYLLAFLFLVAHALFWPALFILDESEGFIFAFNQISIDLTDKQIVGGREHFWNDIIDYINQSAMSGFGIHRSLVDVNGSGLSSHNYYLQVLLQTGYVGLSLLILLIASVWGSLFRLRGQVIGRAAMAVFAGVTVLNIFEVILTQNHLIFGVVFWFVLGVANGTTLTPTESKKFVVNYR